MKLEQLQEVKYAQSDTVKLTGNFFTGNEGEHQEHGVTITVKRGKVTRHEFDPERTRFLGVVQSVKGGEIANEIVAAGTTVRLSKEPEGWSLNGFTKSFDKWRYGDTWVLFDPEYDTEYDQSHIAAVAFRSTKTFEQLQEAKYYRIPSLDEVYAKFVKAMHPSSGDVQVLDVEIHQRRQAVYADVRAWVYSKQEAIQAIKKFLKKHNLPQDVEYRDLNNVHRGDWRAVIVFGMRE